MILSQDDFYFDFMRKVIKKYAYFIRFTLNIGIRFEVCPSSDLPRSIGMGGVATCVILGTKSKKIEKLFLLAGGRIVSILGKQGLIL